MTKDVCTCEKPILRERSDRRGASTSWCDRCKKPLSLRLAQFRSAFS